MKRNDLDKLKEHCYYMYNNNTSINELASFFNRSKQTIYNWIQQKREKYYFPELKAIIKQKLLYGNFKEFVMSLSYKDLCLIRRKLGLYGYNKTTIIESILKYFKSYSILGVYPDNLSRAIVKKAYFKKAKLTHPDLTKKDTSKEFIELYNIYQELYNKCEV